MGDIIAGIDIGTTKVCTMIGRVGKNNELEILGKGMEPCTGVKKGIIVDIENTSNAIRASVQKAESMANLKVKSAYVNIMGAHVTVLNNRTWIPISTENHEINSKDVDTVLHNARNIPIPEDMQVVDVIARQYIIDGYDEIVDPVGMVGLRLEVEADVVAAKITSVQNIVKSIERAGIRINGLVVEALATGEISLSSDEKEMGVILIDVGGGITDISLIKNRKIMFYDSIPVGGDHISNDITIGLKISYADAEKLKRQYELALTSLIKNDQDMQIVDVNDGRKRTVKISEMVEIIEARVYEIFTLCKDTLQKGNINPDMAASIVLTGGGMSSMDGSIQLAGEVFSLPVRVAATKANMIQKSEYATAAGIVKYISSSRRINKSGSDVVALVNKKSIKSNTSFLNRIGKFISELF